MEIFVSTCKAYGIAYEREKVFQFLRTLDSKEQGEQLSLFQYKGITGAANPRKTFSDFLEQTKLTAFQIFVSFVCVSIKNPDRADNYF